MKKISYLGMAGLLFCPALFFNARGVEAVNEFVAPDTIHIEEVVVTGSRVQISRNNMPMTLSVVNRQEIMESSESALLPVLSQRVPGLFVTEKGMTGFGVSGGAAGQISIRGVGSSSGRVLILIDGHPQYMGLFGHPLPDAYIASDAERVEVARGPASLLYGSNAMGGVINIITRKQIEEGFKSQARAMWGSYGTQKYMLSNGFKKGKFSSFVSVNYDKTDGHRPNSGFEITNGYLKLGYDLNAQWKLAGDISLASYNATNPGEINNPIYESWVDITRGMASVSIENQYDKTSGAATMFYSFGDHVINDGYYTGGTPQQYLYESTDYVAGIMLYQAYRPFKGNTLTAGIDFKRNGGDATKGPSVYADKIGVNELAGYLFMQQNLGRFGLSVGSRIENNSLYGSEWVPQAGLSLKATETTYLKASVSKGFRSPNLRELYMFPPANTDLKPEKSMNYEISATQRLLEDKMSLEFNVFYTEGENLIQTQMVSGVPRNLNVGEFANKGIEFSANYSILDNLSLSGNYSYLYMDVPVLGAPKHKLFAGVSYSPGKFALSGNVQYIDGLYTKTGSSPVTSSFTLVDAKIGYRPVHMLDLFLKGENLLGKTYETMYGFPMPGATFMGGFTVNF